MRLERRYATLYLMALLALLTVLPHPAAAASETQAVLTPTPANTGFRVEDFTITGQNVFPDEILKELLADAIGKEYTLPALNELTSCVTRFLRSRGYIVATAYVPPQNIVDGNVNIAVLMGTYGKITIDNKSSVKTSAIERQLGDIKPGALIEKYPLDRAIWLVNDLCGVDAKATLTPGSAVGTSDLIFTVEPSGKRANTELSLDNYGSKFTGENQGGISLGYNNPTGIGDSIYVRGLAGEDLVTGTACWQVPVYNGHTLSFSYSRVSYTLGGEFADLNASGTADVYGARWSYPLLRSGAANIYTTLGYDYKKLHDEDGTGSDSNKRSHIASFGLSGGNLDRTGNTSYSLTYSAGRLRFDTPLDLVIDRATANTNGSFGKLDGNLVREQVLGEKDSLHIALSGQLSTKNLDSSEKFSLGGPCGVRAYPSGEAVGDEGYLATAEYRRLVHMSKTGGTAWQAAGFFDIGGITVNKNPYAEGNNHRTLLGIGLGVLYNDNPSNTAFRVDYAWKLGDEKSESDTDKPGRLWLQVSKDF